MKDDMLVCKGRGIYMGYVRRRSRSGHYYTQQTGCLMPILIFVVSIMVVATIIL